MNYIYKIGKAEETPPDRKLAVSGEREFRAGARRILSRGNTRIFAALGLITAAASFAVFFMLIVTVYILVFGGEDTDGAVSGTLEAAAITAALIFTAPVRAGYIAAASTAAQSREGLDPSAFFAPFESAGLFFRLSFAEVLRTFSLILPVCASFFLCDIIETVSPSLIIFAGVALCFPFAILTRGLRIFAVSAIIMREKSLSAVRESLARTPAYRRAVLRRLDFIYLLSIFISFLTVFILSFAHSAHLFAAEFASVLTGEEETN